jgi:hypothetical protein
MPVMGTLSPISFPASSRQNPGVDHAELIDRARRGYQRAGRGIVVVLRGDEEPRYAPIDEAKASLAGADAEPDLLASVIYATAKYDPKWEAVLFLEGDEGFTVYIVRTNRAEAIGGISWSPVN